MTDPLAAAHRLHKAIRAAFLAHGGTPEQWARVAANPRRFNAAWNGLLHLPKHSRPPPPEYRTLAALERAGHDRHQTRHRR